MFHHERESDEVYRGFEGLMCLLVNHPSFLRKWLGAGV